MSARRLDRFPTGKGLQQPAHQRRLADLGREASDTNDHWTRR
jgi:hypothetical protein